MKKFIFLLFFILPLLAAPPDKVKIVRFSECSSHHQPPSPMIPTYPLGHAFPEASLKTVLYKAIKCQQMNPDEKDLYTSLIALGALGVGTVMGGVTMFGLLPTAYSVGGLMLKSGFVTFGSYVGLFSANMLLESSEFWQHLNQ